MPAAPARRPQPSTAQNVLRWGVGLAVMMAACFGGARPRTIESPVESPIEAILAVESGSRARVSEPRETNRKSGPSTHYCSCATNPYSPTHNLLAGPAKGHRLPNGLTAPLIC